MNAQLHALQVQFFTLSQTNICHHLPICAFTLDDTTTGLKRPWKKFTGFSEMLDP